MKILDKYTAEYTGHGWTLTRSYEAKDKDGKPKTAYKDTYYPTLKRTLQKVLDLEAASYETVGQLSAAFNRELKEVADLRDML